MMFDRIKEIFRGNGNSTPLREAESQLERTEARLLTALNRSLKESIDLLSDNYVDPAEALLGPEGTAWEPIGGGMGAGRCGSLPYRTEEELAKIRDYCRYLGHSNEFAIGGHENRISYVVGNGHVYTAVKKKDQDPSVEEVAAVQAEVDDFCKRNKWSIVCGNS